MTIRPFLATDHPTVSAWWTLQSWPVMPLEALPQTGLIVDGVCAGFLYQTDSSIAWLEFIIANPLCDKLLRDKGLDLLIPGLLGKAKELGKSTVLTSVTHPGLVKRYEKHGGIITDRGMTNFVWRV